MFVARILLFKIVAMKKNVLLFAALFFLSSVVFFSCSNDNDPGVTEPPEVPEEPGDGNGDGNSGVVTLENVLVNQIDSVVIPTVEHYAVETGDLLGAAQSFSSALSAENLTALRQAYQSTYLAYQAIAVHNYFATVNQGLVPNTNLYPIDVDLLTDFIASEAYNFNTTDQERANGFPALDYLLYGPEDVLGFFEEDELRVAFLLELVISIDIRAQGLEDQWTGSLRDNFVGNTGTALGSSVSEQLNQITVYYEEHIRENKVGIAIGRLGPNDTPIDPSPTHIEAYYQSLVDGNDTFTFQLLRAAVEEVEDFYLGSEPSGADGASYDDLLIAADQASIDADIKTQFENIYAILDSRTTVSGDDTLYEAIQQIVTLFKSDLFPVLNVQDADGMNDGD